MKDPTKLIREVIKKSIGPNLETKIKGMNELLLTVFSREELADFYSAKDLITQLLSNMSRIDSVNFIQSFISATKDLDVVVKVDLANDVSAIGVRALMSRMPCYLYVDREEFLYSNVMENIDRCYIDSSVLENSNFFDYNYKKILNLDDFIDVEFVKSIRYDLAEGQLLSRNDYYINATKERLEFCEKILEKKMLDVSLSPAPKSSASKL